MSPRGRPRLYEARDINIKRLFTEEQLRVSTIAQQFHMSDKAVSVVIQRRVGPAFDGCPTTTVPVLWRLQKAYAELYGETQALQLLKYFKLLNGQSAEAYVLQEAGISSELYNILVQGNKSRGVRLRKMVEIDPKAAWFAVQRLEEKGNWALEIQAGRIRRYLGSDEPIQEEVAVAPILVAKKIVRVEKSKQRGSLAVAKKKGVAKSKRRSVQIPWRNVFDVLMAASLIALMVWLLMTVG